MAHRLFWLILLISPISSNASPITFSFDGFATNGNGLALPGDSVFFSYTFDTTTLDNCGNPTLGCYTGAITDMELRYGPTVFDTSVINHNFIQVDNGRFADQYDFSALLADQAGLTNIEVTLRLIDETATALDNDLIPQTLDILAYRQPVKLFIIGHNPLQNNFVVDLTRFTKVDEPRPLSLCMASLLVLMCARLKADKPFCC